MNRKLLILIVISLTLSVVRAENVVFMVSDNELAQFGDSVCYVAVRSTLVKGRRAVGEEQVAFLYDFIVGKPVTSIAARLSPGSYSVTFNIKGGIDEDLTRIELEPFVVSRGSQIVAIDIPPLRPIDISFKLRPGSERKVTRRLVIKSDNKRYVHRMTLQQRDSKLLGKWFVPIKEKKFVLFISTDEGGIQEISKIALSPQQLLNGALLIEINP